MPGHVAIDFGTSNTLIAVWDENQEEALSLQIPDLSRQIHYSDNQKAWIIPSLINYDPGGECWLGQQVIERNLYDSPQTFRWLKRYISSRNNAKIQVNGKSIGFYEAGRDFLSGLLIFAASELSQKDEEVAFTAPVEAFEHYENWLTKTAEKAGIFRFRIIDESSAAALGYGLHILPGNVYLVFDFGGGTLDVSIVVIEEDGKAASGRRCRVVGKAGVDLGGATIDQWIFQDILRQNRLNHSFKNMNTISRKLLSECERIKEKLTFHDRAEISLPVKNSKVTIKSCFTKNEFEELLRKNEFDSLVDRTIRRALREAWEKGYSEDDIQSVLMVGGSSLIPAAGQTVKRFFGKDRVMLSRPLDAVVRGAAAFAAGKDFYDYIQHNYAVRYVDPGKNRYKYHTIVEKGTPYPTEGPVAKLSIKATYENQQQLGLAIFEMGNRNVEISSVELIFDPSGAARIIDISPEAKKKRTLFWMNENSPTFLNAIPPAIKGEKRFDVDFLIDGNKRLLLTARDKKTGEAVMKNYPVVKLN